MRARSLSLLTAIAFAVVSWKVTAQPTNRGGQTSHDHSTTATGGSTLAPKVLSMLSTSTATLRGSVVCSTCSFFTTEGSTLTIRGYMPGFTVEISTALVSAVTSYTFVVSSTIPYRLDYNLIQNTAAGGHYIIFNGDTGANYVYGVHGMYSNTLGGNSDGGAAKTGCGMTDLVTEIPKAGTGVKGWHEFESTYSLPKIIKGNGRTSWTENSVSYNVGSNTTCDYTGAAVLSSMTYVTSAGTFSGYFELKKYHRR